jgi:4-carboxymuconolactone decarboxylase
MDTLSIRERELVALGAALGSNCVPCIEYHVPEARKAGLSDRQISEAIQLADKVRQVPARKVLDTALAIVTKDNAGSETDRPDAGCARPASGAAPRQGCCG